MSDLETIFEEVKERSAEWRPKFVDVEDVRTLADMINKPHEDYPKRVDATEFCIRSIIGFDEHEMDEGFLFLCHSTIMTGLESRGRYRTKEVHIVGSSQMVNVATGEILTKREIVYTPPNYLLIPYLMSRIMPVRSTDDLIQWYRLFQSIHPFEDGNGRVGGVILGVLNFLKTGKYLAPLQ